jgi:hypothetical protein
VKERGKVSKRQQREQATLWNEWGKRGTPSLFDGSFDIPEETPPAAVRDEEPTDAAGNEELEAEDDEVRENIRAEREAASAVEERA